VLERELRIDHKDVGIVSLHPDAVPDTPNHGHYVTGGRASNSLDITTDDQILKYVDLAKICGKGAYVVPSDVSSARTWGHSSWGGTLAGVIDSYYSGTQVIGGPGRVGGETDPADPAYDRISWGNLGCMGNVTGDNPGTVHEERPFDANPWGPGEPDAA
jgi:hypothetical protein